MRSSLSRPSAIIVACGLLFSACGDDASDHEALVKALSSQDQMTTEEATCIADDIFEEGRYTEDEMKKAGKDITAVDGFQEAVEAAMDSCIK